MYKLSSARSYFEFFTVPPRAQDVRATTPQVGARVSPSFHAHVCRECPRLNVVLPLEAKFPLVVLTGSARREKSIFSELTAAS